MPSFLPLLPIPILLLTALVLLVIRLARPRFAYFWLVAALGALLTWPLVLLARLNIPQSFPLVTWQPETFFSSSPVLLLDGISWSFAVALATLVLAVILTDVARASETDWLAWASSLVLTAVGLVAVMSGNPLTLLLAWAAIDLGELAILLGHVASSAVRERVVVAFSARVGGIVLLLWAVIAARSSGTELTFESIPQQVSVYLLLAAGLRLGVLPSHQPFLREIPLRRGLGTISRLVPAAASLILLARTANTSVPPAAVPYLLGLAGLAALYAGFSWVSAKDELDGRPFWILGMAAFAVAAAVRGQPAASLAWGLALLFSGGLLFLLSTRYLYLLVLSLLGLIGFSTLPFTPAADGSWLYAPPFQPLLVIFLVAQFTLLIGYVRHALRPSETLSGVERWVLVIYPWGLALFPLAQFIVGFWGRQDPVRQEIIPLSATGLWPGIVTMGLVILWIIGARFLELGPLGIRVADRGERILKSVFSLGWFYRFLWGAYRLVGRFLAFLSNVLEGEGGVLWALLLLVLLLAYLAQGRLGG